MANDNEETDATTQIRYESKFPDLSKQKRRPVLITLRGELLGAPIPLERDVVTIGRVIEADIRLNDSKTSRLHAQISIGRTGTGGPIFTLRDLGSTNGTLVNGRRITETPLADGDKILIGEHLFRFELLDEIDQEFQQQVHRLIGHDELTGLLTSKSFFVELRREAARAEEKGQPFCVLMMDLDHFKQINDRYGHLVGSRALQDVGVIIKAALRSGDVASRFGGEEFAAFLLDADYAQAIVAAERIRRAVEVHDFLAATTTSADRGEVFRVTVSIGVAVFPVDAKDPIQLVEMADSALYRAKRSGRNMICAHSPSLAALEAPLRPRRD
ncbi:MAG TPA: GGDEF domain-containing protein [Pyrinomonadaceae bacterium]|nr:GGDEF domain-containing protein [Pyrinomonadaceae bacterium]